MNPDGSDQKQLTTEPQFMEELRSGGDGRYLFFSVPKDRHSNLFRINTDGTDMRQFTHGPSVIDSGVSHDGRSIVYSGSVVKGLRVELGLWKMPVEGGEPVNLGVDGCDMPHFSPNDEFISCVEDQARVKILSAADGKVLRTFDLAPRSTVNFGARWAPDGKSIAFVSDRSGIANLFLYELGDKEHYQLTNVVGAITAIAGGGFRP